MNDSSLLDSKAHVFAHDHSTVTNERNDCDISDAKQRMEALDTRRSFIVQAPAGSGKTELLIQRFLALLNTVKSPEEIMAITFTKKAANEMRTRIIHALKFAKHAKEPSLVHEKQTWQLAKQVLARDAKYQWNLIDNPNQMRIQTIDSLCAYLTNQLPLLSHFGSSPVISENPEGLYREAVQEVLTHLEENFSWSQSIATLLLHLDNDLNKLHDLFINLLCKRDQWLPYIHLDLNDNEIRNELELHLQLIIADRLKLIHALLPKSLIPDLLATLRYAASHLQDNLTSSIANLVNLTALPEVDFTGINAWIGIANFLLTKDGEWRKSFDARIGIKAATNFKNIQEKEIAIEFKERATNIITQLINHEKLRIALAEIEKLPDAHYQDNQWEVLKSLLQILKIMVAQLRVSFQLHGEIDFIENVQGALLALGNDDHPTDLALALDYQIKHILVDEFQDTSLTQYQLLSKLTYGWETDDGRTLFIVGDPMQSIYRFRQAEVGLFIQMRENGIGNIHLTPLTLSTNFRSLAQIIEWNNKIFHAIFPNFNDIATGAINFHRSKPVTNNLDDEPAISIHGFIEQESNAQAEHIISVINRLKHDHPNEKIAILVRSRSHLISIMEALKKAKLNYRAHDIDPLASKQSVQDLLSLTCALSHLGDRIAWLSVLRAPWCGLTLSDLHVIAGNHPQQTIWECLIRDDTKQKLSPDGLKRINRILPILKAKLADKDRMNFRYWIETTWNLLGGPAVLNEYDDILDIHSFFNLLQEFNQTNMQLDTDKLKAKMNELFALNQNESANIDIMTIHSAKGLEFDTVILPHLERKTSNDDKTLMLWMERPLTNKKVALLLAPIHAIGNNKDPIYEYIYQQQKNKLAYEADRLLYVATTRAKKRLYLFFDAKRNEKNEIKIEPNSFLTKLWPLIKNDFNEHNHLKFQETTSSQTENIPSHQYLYRLTHDWNNCIIDFPHSIPAFHLNSNGFQLADKIRPTLGIVMHKVLQQLALFGIDWWKLKTLDHQTNYLSHQLKQLYLDKNEMEKSVQFILNAINKTLTDERGKWILKNHHDARCEFAISMFDQTIENLIIDRTFIDENNIRWIIDYKTTTFTPTDLDEFLSKEYDKYLEKMKKYHHAMQLVSNQTIRLGLYFPVLSAWREWEF